MKSEILYPCLPLRGFIKYYWILEADTINHEELVYPTGDMQMLFHYGNPFKMITNSGMEDQPGIALCGQVSSVMRVAANETCGVIAAVLYPYAAKFFFDFSMIEITDLVVDITGIARDSFFLREQISECNDTPSRIRIIENYLMNRLNIQNMNHLHIMRKTIRDIIASGGIVSLDYLVSGSGISLRQFERIFSSHTGFSPKRFTEIIRFNNAVQSMKTSSDFADIACKNGFYDQSHFIKVFKKNTGLTPGAFRKKYPDLCSSVPGFELSSPGIE